MKTFTQTLLLLSCACLLSPSYRVQSPARDSWDVPQCVTFSNYKQNKSAYIRMPILGANLFLPRAKEVRSRKVNDVDYELYVFSFGPNEQRNILQGWFGPYAADRSVREKSKQKSANFTERWATIGNDKALDSSGQTRDGKYWRYLDLGSSSLYYEDASGEAAKVFDSMLAKMCYEAWKL
jgi:hypothetical protein